VLVLLVVGALRLLEMVRSWLVVLLLLLLMMMLDIL
jgi:hypothetical protein